MPRQPAISTCGAYESALRERVSRPASFARWPNKVNSHPIPHTQTDIHKMATQIDASSDAAATAAAQHTPMMQQCVRLI
nr:DNA mismatch repair protein [Burkholderia oklahomensis]